jgi:hypothetical protein
MLKNNVVIDSHFNMPIPPAVVFPAWIGYCWAASHEHGWTLSHRKALRLAIGSAVIQASTFTQRSTT